MSETPAAWEARMRAKRDAMFRDEKPAEVDDCAAKISASTNKKSNTQYGFYSREADRYYGHTYYLDSKGNKVRCTAIFSKRDITKDDYGWKDTVYVGEVTKFLGRE